MNDPHASSDPWLDARLRNVPLPLGLLARLEEIADPENARMDEALADVPLPDGFLERLADISRGSRRPRAAWRGLALAASLLLAIGLGYWSTIGGGFGAGGGGFGAGGGGFGAGGQPQIAQEKERDKQVSPLVGRPEQGGGLDLAADKRFAQASQVEPPAAKPSDREDAAGGRNGSPVRLADGRLADEQLANGAADRPQDPVSLQAAPVEQKLAHDAAGSAQPARPIPTRPLQPANPVRAAGRLALDAGATPDERLLDGTYGAADRFEELPDLELVQVRPPRGMSPPLVAEYDLRFLLNHGQHPFVAPAANKALQTVEPPLVTSAAGYRRLARSVAAGRAPSPEDVRTEDFLAALDYGFAPAPAGSVAIEVAAGPAPLSDEGWSLLQVALHAGALREAARAPTRLTLVVDASTSMRQADRWLALQQALGQLVGDLGADDRLTLVAYTTAPELLAENLSRDEINRDGSGRLEGLLRAVEPRRTADLAAAMQMACSVSAAPAAAKSENHLLIISGGRVDSGARQAERTLQRVAELAKTGVKTTVLDYSRHDRASGALGVWAQAAAGQLVRVADADTMHWRLLEALLGHPPVVAEQASLKIAFNPEVVASYRLFGHERTTLTGPGAAETEIALRPGETATVLFELALKLGIAPRVATVEAKWREPSYGRQHSEKREVKRGQFSPTFAAAPTSLQMAAVAAFGAETLRGSYFAPASRSLAPVNELARQVAKPILNQASFAELTSFFEQAEWARKHPGARNSQPSPADEH